MCLLTAGARKSTLASVGMLPKAETIHYQHSVYITYIMYDTERF